MSDPFATIPAADPAEFDVRPKSAFAKTYADPLGDSSKKRKKVDLNPFQRRWFARNGWQFARVEHANAWGRVSQDLWGAFDYIAVKADSPGVLFVQVTTKTNLSHRRKKIREAPETAVLLAAGNRVEIHAWHQPGGKGTAWRVQVEVIGRREAAGEESNS